MVQVVPSLSWVSITAHAVHIWQSKATSGKPPHWCRPFPHDVMVMMYCPATNTPLPGHPLAGLWRCSPGPISESCFPTPSTILFNGFLVKSWRRNQRTSNHQDANCHAARQAIAIIWDFDNGAIILAECLPNHGTHHHVKPAGGWFAAQALCQPLLPTEHCWSGCCLSWSFGRCCIAISCCLWSVWWSCHGGGRPVRIWGPKFEGNEGCQGLVRSAFGGHASWFWWCCDGRCGLVTMWL